MKIGFDVSQTAENKAGCGFFADQLIQHLVQKDQVNDYMLYPVFYNYRSSKYKEATRPQKSNVKLMFADSSFGQVIRLWDNLKIDRNKLLGSPDLIHANNFSCPKDVDAKKIVTVYDMSFLDCPEFTTEENRIVCFSGVFDASIYADHIITISQSSKKAFLKYFPHYPEERISVVYLGNRASLSNRVNTKTLDRTMHKLSLKEKFWLSVGTVEPRKNYELLFKAYARFISDSSDNFPLYIAGGKGWLESDIGRMVESLGIKDSVKFLGYVSDDELSVLYTKCYAFIYPSFYEGFGLPVLEAMSCGAPIICSKTTSLPEIVEDAGVFIDPFSVNSLVDAMVRVKENEHLRENLKSRAINQCQKFSWDNAAERVLDIYEKTMEMKPWFL